MDDIAAQWRTVFYEVIKQYETADHFRQIMAKTDWTEALTTSVVESCRQLGWEASAKHHKWDRFPGVKTSEFLGIDVMAFLPDAKTWCFPVAVFELENQTDTDRIAYNLWKVLCVRTKLRGVICYADQPEDAPELIRSLQREIIQALAISERMQLSGETFVVVGNRGDVETFPYSFFKWYQLDKNTGQFQIMRSRPS